jgi:hypothetical protein
MGILLGLLILFLSNIIGVGLFALLSAWLLTLAWPIPLDQALWLSLGMIVVIRYGFLDFTATPGVPQDATVFEIIVSDIIFVILLTLSAALGWLLLKITPINLTIFQAILLFAISLTTGVFFLLRAGAGRLPWAMQLSDDDEIEEEYIPPPPKKSRGRRGKASQRWNN